MAASWSLVSKPSAAGPPLLPAAWPPSGELLLLSPLCIRCSNARFAICHIIKLSLDRTLAADRLAPGIPIVLARFFSAVDSTYSVEAVDTDMRDHVPQGSSHGQLPCGRHLIPAGQRGLHVCGIWHYKQASECSGRRTLSRLSRCDACNMDCFSLACWGQTCASAQS